MPYEIVRDESACSASKPYALKKKSDGKVMGCHPSHAAATAQMAALHAAEPGMRERAVAAEARRRGMT